MLKFSVLLLLGALGVVAQPTASTPPPSGGAAPNEPVDGIRILDVQPAKLAIGQEQDVIVRIAYDLRSRDAAQIQVGFNTSGPTRFRVFNSDVVARGAGEMTLSARVTPRDWGSLVFFQAFVTLSEIRPPPAPPQPGQPAPAPRRALAVDHAPIALTKE